MLKKFRLRCWFTPLTGREKWLNQMADKGYRLRSVSRFHRYTFEPCRPGEFRYCVDFVADKSRSGLEDYRRFLSGLGVSSYPVSASTGKFACGDVRIRWFGGARFSLATAPGNINSEFLILEKVNDGKPFSSHSGFSDRIGYFRKIRGSSLGLIILFVLLSVMSAQQSGRLIAALPGMVLGVLPTVYFIICSWKIHCLKREHQIHE
jgi:hypothetical protein